MANPKRKISKSESRSRRALNPLVAHQLVRCVNCGLRIRPHTICTGCGYYRKRQIIYVDR